jgi:DNA-binding IclR family transcriptional regulator
VARDQAETGCDHVLTKEAGNSNVRAVERALQILGCFDDKHAERGVSEIAQAVGLHKATAHRIVTTLMAYGYLERAEDGQRYRLGTRLANLGFMVIRRTDLRREAMPIMTELAARLDETCDLSVYNRGEVYFIEVVQGSRALTVAAAVGRSLPIHATASGKVILAFVPEAESEAALDEPLVAHTHRTIMRPAELRRQLEVVRAQGYAIDDEELELGVRAVSAPVRDRDGNVIGALRGTCPTSRLPLDRVPSLAAEVRQAADAISARLGWHT